MLRERAKGLYDSREGVICAHASVAKAEGKISAHSKNSEPFSTFWNALVENACWYDVTSKRADTDEILQTAGGKFEFSSQRLQNALVFGDDLMYMPHYSALPPSPEGFDLLIVPETLACMADNGVITPPLLIKQLSDKVLVKDDLFVQMNPITAMYQGLKEGDTVTLESTCGKAKVRIHMFAGVREGVVLVPLGFGHTAYDEFLQNKGVNAHQIIEAKKDAVSGLPVWWATPGKVYRV